MESRRKQRGHQGKRGRLQKQNKFDRKKIGSIVYDVAITVSIKVKIGLIKIFHDDFLLYHPIT